MGTTETPQKEPSILLYILLSKVQKVSSGSERQVLTGIVKNSLPQPHALTKTISESFCNPVVEEWKLLYQKGTISHDERNMYYRLSLSISFLWLI